MKKSKNPNNIEDSYSINADLILKTLKAKNFTVESFVKFACIPLDDFQKILNNNQHLPLWYLVKISRLLNINYENLFITRK